MNTPSHAIINLGFLDKKDKGSTYSWTIVLGGILPDIPIFLSFFTSFIVSRSTTNILAVDKNYTVFWNTIVNLFHSLPLPLIAIFVFLILRMAKTQIFFVSILLHNLSDFFMHSEDAYRQFYPFSSYRFISPVSYYDPKHFGWLGAGIELVIVLIATLLIIDRNKNKKVKIILLTYDILLVIVHIIMYGVRNSLS